jgi:ornithine cyclodeaminase
MLFLNSENILHTLSPNQLMDKVVDALLTYEKKEFVMPERLTVDCGNKNSLLLMPCQANGNISSKVITVFPTNKAKNKLVLNGVVLLNDQETGEILALLDGKTLTAMRTGAVSGVSIRYLAADDATSVGLIGCGVQGFYQLLHACAARQIERINLFDISTVYMNTLAEKLKETFPDVSIGKSVSTKDLVNNSEIIIAATTAGSPVIENDPTLFKGKHCIAIGSFHQDVREYPDAIFSGDGKVWVDTDIAIEESGELFIPIQNGILSSEQVETLGHFIQSGVPINRETQSTTFFKSVGMALFDLFAAQLAYQNALQNGIGEELSL